MINITLFTFNKFHKYEVNINFNDMKLHLSNNIYLLLIDMHIDVYEPLNNYTFFNIIQNFYLTKHKYHLFQDYYMLLLNHKNYKEILINIYYHSQYNHQVINMQSYHFLYHDISFFYNMHFMFHYPKSKYKALQEILHFNKHFLYNMNNFIMKYNFHHHKYIQT